MSIRVCAGAAALIVLPLGAAFAQDRQTMGRLSAVIDGQAMELEIFEGPLNGFVRALGAYRTGFGGDGGMISIEAVPAQVAPGANTMEGMAGLRLDFSAPAPLDASSIPDEVDLFYVSQWRDGLQDPEAFYRSVGEVKLHLDRLSLTEGAPSIAGEAAGSLCPHDVDTDMQVGGAEDCLEAVFTFDTALAPFAPPVPVASAPSDLAEADPAPASPPPGEGPVTMDVLGTITATMNGEQREWLTIAGNIDGEAGASANWQRSEFTVPGFADSFAGMEELLSPEERMQLQALDEMMGEANPFGEMMEQFMGQAMGQTMGGSEQISLTISGHDPASPNILTEQVLVLDVFLTRRDPPLGEPISADISYFVEASGSFIPRLFYVSGEDGSEASVTFDRLDLEPGGGHAAGSFSASMCRMEWDRLMEGADLSDCMAIEGRFDTALVEEDPIQF